MAEKDAAGGRRRAGRYRVGSIGWAVEEATGPGSISRVVKAFTGPGSVAADIRGFSGLDEPPEDAPAQPPPVEQPAPASPPPPANRWEPPASTDAEIPEGVPLYERRDAPAWFVARLRKFYGPFQPHVWQHWIRIDHCIEGLQREIGTVVPEGSKQARLSWTPEQLVAYMERVGLLEPDTQPNRTRGSRGATTCERLRGLHRQDPDFAETASIRKVAKRIGRSPGAFPDCHYYNTVLKPKRAEVAARKKRVNRAQKWGDFNSVGGPREDPEDH